MPDQDYLSPPQGRILVADDEPHIRRILTTFLEGAGFLIDEALAKRSGWLTKMVKDLGTALWVNGSK